MEETLSPTAEELVATWRASIAGAEEKLAVEISKAMSAAPLAFQSKVLATPDDLANIPYGPAFYVICSNYAGKEVAANPCSYVTAGDLRAVYRGHAYSPRARLKSHLFTKEVKKDLYPARMKLFEDSDGKSVNGVNIHEGGRLLDVKWRVDFIELPGSIASIREAFEMAFDKKYKRPILSRE